MIPEAKNPFRTQQARILGLVGSPRKLGNCEVFIKEIFRNVPVPSSLHLIRMPSLEIESCDACYRCIMDEPCPHKDDMEKLLKEIASADAVIIASPVYFLGVHSIFKRILDRGFLIYRYIHETHGKPCILINTYGMTDRIGTAPQALWTLASYLTLDIKASLNIKAALPGEIITTKKNRHMAKRLGKMLFSDKSLQRTGGCPFCGCDIVRISGGKFICTLCHGHFTQSAEDTFQKQKKGGIFGPPDYVLKHKKWLQGMKGKFIAHRKEFVKILSAYRNIGEWIK